METILGVNQLEKPLKGSVLTVGSFDGVHMGHQELLRKVKEKSAVTGLPSTVMTFNPHPVQFLQPQKGFQRLFPLSDLEERLRSLGIDVFIMEPFTKEFSEVTPESYLVDWIVRPLSPSHIIVGYDFSFGSKKSGSIDFLKEKSKEHNFALEVIDPIYFNSEVVSSSRIRKLIAEAKVEEAEQLLTRKFYLGGALVKGQGRGRQIGVPTANLNFNHKSALKQGVYCTRAIINGQDHPAVTNVGINPTFNTPSPDQQSFVETHILDFNQEQSDQVLYGKAIKIQFCKYLRPEKKFPDVEELKKQITLDIKQALSYHKSNEVGGIS